jgi:hypothetical protein
MRQKNIVRKLFFISFIMIFLSCNAPKRLYIANQTGRAITLTVDSNLVADKGTALAAFKDSLEGKQIDPGHITIKFGVGKWQKSDEISLQRLMQNIRYTKLGSTKIYLIPNDITISRGTFIQELIVRIKH